MSMTRSHQKARAEGGDVPDHRFLVLYGASRSVEHGPYRAEFDALSADGWVEAVPTISRAWFGPDWKDGPAASRTFSAST
jgi:ferredoxin--NADP+ reductase